MSTSSSPILWNALLYSCSIITYLVLFWIYRNVPQKLPSNGHARNRSKTSEHNELHHGCGDQEKHDTLNNNTIKMKTHRRFSSFRRRKELVEKDIVLNLGLTPDEKGFEAFCDKFNSIEKVSEALRQAEFQSCDIVIGIDFTASNEWQGKRSFGRSSLHNVQSSKTNPYHKVLKIVGKTLSHICKDNSINTYGFGDSITKHHSVFPVHQTPIAVSDYHQVIEAYKCCASTVQLSGPTNFAPVINKAIELCKASGRYLILFMVVDGLVSSQCEQETIDTIVEASNYPLSIVVIGVGDGPFGTMFEYDDGLPTRKFDNLQFVNFHRTVTKPKHEAAFALHAFMEIPDQYKAIQQLGYLTQ